MANVLLLGSGTQGLAFVQSLSKLGHSVFLLSSDKHNYAEDSRYLSGKYNLRTSNDSEYLTKIQMIVTENKIDCLIPMGDSSAEFVSRNQSELSFFVKFATPEYSSFLKGYDKNQLMHLCEAKGYPHPRTADLSVTPLESVKDFPFPAMLKPNRTTGGRGMVMVNSYSELCEKYPSLHEQYGDYHLQKFIKPGGRQVKVQLYIDRNLVASSVMQKLRWYPNNGGSNSCGVSIKDDGIVGRCYDILKEINWYGFADFDLIGDPDTGELMIMEINPRIPACVKTVIAAGIDWSEIIVNDILGTPQKQYQYHCGEYTRHLGFETLWFLHANDRMHTKPCWFKFFGSHIHYQDMSDWTDPLPFICGTWQNIKKLFNPDFRKSKQGV